MKFATPLTTGAVYLGLSPDAISCTNAGMPGSSPVRVNFRFERSSVAFVLNSYSSLSLLTPYISVAASESTASL